LIFPRATVQGGGLPTGGVIDRRGTVEGELGETPVGKRHILQFRLDANAVLPAHMAA